MLALVAGLFASAVAGAPLESSGTNALAAVEETLGELDTEVTVAKAASPSAPAAETVVAAGGASNKNERLVKITSVRTDYDRREGVIMFDRNVFVDDPEYKLHADRVYVFLDGTNDMKRIVALGNVAVTNGLRTGSCAKATYSRANSKLVMYGDNETGMPARLEDNGEKRGELVGRKITFWTDTEQVEVEGSQITVDAGGKDGADAAKKIFGK